MEQKATTVFNVKGILKLQSLGPQTKHANIFYCICSRCHYVNAVTNNFCINCGHPVKEQGTATLYHVRIKQRKEILRKGEKAVYAARVTLYALSIFFMVGISFLFGNHDSRYLLALASITFSGLFFLLARWSYSRPFTAIITGFIIVLTFSTISIFGEFVNAFTTVVGVYSILVTMILIYFLLRGVQGAYKVDL